MEKIEINFWSDGGKGFDATRERARADVETVGEEHKVTNIEKQHFTGRWYTADKGEVAAIERQIRKVLLQSSEKFRLCK